MSLLSFLFFALPHFPFSYLPPPTQLQSNEQRMRVGLQTQEEMA
jgi:hypothetical protein